MEENQFERREATQPKQWHERPRLRLNPGSISGAICVSVLVYDVLGFVVCFQWGAATWSSVRRVAPGMLAVRGYSVLFGRVAARCTACYVASCLIYASAVVVLTSRLVFRIFPSADEAAAAVPTDGRPSEWSSEHQDAAKRG